jgi:DNA-binding GntR family transcriptional regulator
MPATKTNGIPAYKRIQEKIRAGIDAGELRTGNVVPSERELARIHDVSLMTARHALASLEREGLVERRRGVGTFRRRSKNSFQ